MLNYLIPLHFCIILLITILSLSLFSTALCFVLTKSGLFSVPLSEGRKAAFYCRESCLELLKLPTTSVSPLPLDLSFKTFCRLFP